MSWQHNSLSSPCIMGRALCALRHGIQNSMEATMACHPATECLDWVAVSCKLWRMRTGVIVRCYRPDLAPAHLPLLSAVAEYLLLPTLIEIFSPASAEPNNDVPASVACPRDGESDIELCGRRKGEQTGNETMRMEVKEEKVLQCEHVSDFWCSLEGRKREGVGKKGGRERERERERE